MIIRSVINLTCPHCGYKENDDIQFTITPRDKKTNYNTVFCSQCHKVFACRVIGSPSYHTKKFKKCNYPGCGKIAIDKYCSSNHRKQFSRHKNNIELVDFEYKFIEPLKKPGRPRK